MKQYIIQPEYKKSVVEWTNWSKEIDGVVHQLHRELGWRWGSFVLYVPETEEEIKAFMEERGYEDLDAMLEDYGVESIEEMCLPEEGDDEVELEDYDYELIETWDGCWDDFTVNCWRKGGLSEDARYELAEELQEIYDEDYEEGIEDAGWGQDSQGFSIVGGFTLKEVPEGKSPYEVYDEG